MKEMLFDFISDCGGILFRVWVALIVGFLFVSMNQIGVRCDEIEGTKDDYCYISRRPDK